MRDENGRILPGSYQRAVEQREATLDAAVTALDPDVNGIPWVSRGPANIGGRTRALLIDPGSPNVLLAGAVSGGIWRSTDAGASWSMIDDRMRSLAICCLTRDPVNPDLVYAGTGEGFFNGDAIGGAGIYRSEDGGLTWTQMPATANWDTVNRIAICPTNSNLILAARRYGGIQRSTDGGLTWSVPRWTQGAYDVDFHPTDGARAVAHVIDYDWDNNQWFHAAWYSTDGGATWQASGGLGRVDDFGSRIELAYARSSPNLVYASCGASGGQIWRSTDGGQNYALRSGANQTQGNWYANSLWVDPANSNVVVTGGYHLFRSTDGGTNWSQISDGYIDTTSPHPDQHGIIAAPGYNGTTNRQAYAVTDGSIYFTNDIRLATPTTGWMRRDLTYRTTQFYGADGHGSSGKIVGGTQDNGTLKLENGSDNAYLTYGGDGGFCAIDDTNPNYVYGEYVALLMVGSSDGGQSVRSITANLPDAGTNANFIAPFILDPNNQARMLAGGASLWRTENVRAHSPSWTAIRPAGSERISAIAVAPGQSQTVFVGQNDGVVSKTTNGLAASPAWTDVSATLPDRYVTRIVFEPGNANVVYACFGGWSADNLWRSLDGGATWTDVTSAAPLGLPDVPIRGFAVHPANANRLFAGTEIGLFTSSDRGATWTTQEYGPANVSIDEVVFMSGSHRLLLATHGRGLWTADLANAGGFLRGTVTLENLGVAPDGAQVQIEVRNPGSATVRSRQTVKLLAGGAFAIDPQAPTGTYDVAVKGSHWLRQVRSSVTITTGGATGLAFSLKNGDVTDDNAVDLDDFLVLASSYEADPGSAAFDPRADLDGDGSVGLADFLILASNYELSGAP